VFSQATMLKGTAIRGENEKRKNNFSDLTNLSTAVGFTGFGNKTQQNG
jgi:hypothetical protein